MDIEKEIGAEAEAHLHQLEEADELQAERQTGQKDAEVSRQAMTVRGKQLRRRLVAGTECTSNCHLACHVIYFLDRIE